MIDPRLDSDDWACVFGESDCDNVSGLVDECLPGADMDRTTPTREDVDEIIAMVNGENDQSDRLGVFRLKDGRYLFAKGGCCSIEWVTYAWNRLYVAASLGDLLRYGISSQDRERLGLGDAS